MSTESQPASGRGRRPAAQVRAEVLAVTSAMLLKEGYSALSFERISRESKASKTTLYKWWPSIGALAAESFFQQSEPKLKFPDTGDLRADLISQLSSFVKLMTQNNAGKRVAELVGAAQLDPELAKAWAEKYSHPRRELARARLKKAQENEGLAEDAEIDIIIDQLWGACYHRLLILMVSLQDLDLSRLVDQALLGIFPSRQI